MSALILLPIIVIVLGIVVGNVSGKRAFFGWCAWMLAVGLISYYISTLSNGPLLAVPCALLGTAASFWIAALSGRRKTLNENAVVPTVVRGFQELPAHHKRQSGAIAVTSARLGAAIIADKVRDTHPTTSAKLADLSRK